MRRVKRTELPKVRKLLLNNQANKCAICGIKFGGKQVACVDHDHNAGHIRGALCRNCNRAEGKIKTLATSCKRGGTQLEWLKSLVFYLDLHVEPQTQYLHPDHKSEDEKRETRNRKARLAYAKRKAKENL